MTDHDDDPILPDLADEPVLTGAAADSSAPDEALKDLPRILRYAHLAQREAQTHLRLAAEIEVIWPRQPLSVVWAAAPDLEHGLALAEELDRRAVLDDDSVCRSLADAVRLLALPVPRDPQLLVAHRRVAKALLGALQHLPEAVGEKLRASSEAFVFGWAALPACTSMIGRAHDRSAVSAAAALGKRMAEHRIAASEAAVWAQANARREDRLAARAAEDPPRAGDVEVPDGQVIVARLDEGKLANSRTRDLIAPLKRVINVPLPLVPTPPLAGVRSKLLAEFPYAPDVVDFALAELVGRPFAFFKPLLVVGPPGSGKTRFANALGRALGLFVARTDAARAEGSVFAGTDRRWATAEACHPLLSIAQAGKAGILVLIDEIDKPATRTDYGRLWDALLALLEIDTARRYPDPALQVEIDLSHVSYVATANAIDGLPGPVRDRFRIVEFPRPSLHDLKTLLPAVIDDLARERAIDPRWIPSFSQLEETLVARAWNGGSMRRLRRIVEIVLRRRERDATRN